MRRSRALDPFAALGLPRRAGLTNDEVRAAWRRVAAATHPDRADGGDPARFAAAAAAYMALRTATGRGETLADLPERAGTSRVLGRWTAPAARRLAWPHGGHGRGGHSRGGQTGSRRGPVPAEPLTGTSGGRDRLLPATAILTRVRQGRPARLALRLAAAGAAATAAVLIAGWQPATPALITGAATWLALTARRDLGPTARRSPPC